MAAEENAPVGAAGEGDATEERAGGARRSLWLIFGLLVVAALLIVAGLLIERARTERVRQGTPVAPLPSGAGAAPSARRPPGP